MKCILAIAAAVLALALSNWVHAQVVISANLQYTWPAATATTVASPPSQLGSYIVLNGVYAPRPANYSITWTDAGTAPSACTFNAQGSPDNVTWTSLDGGSPIDCTTSGAEFISLSPVLYVRIYMATFTQGSSSTKVTFNYVGSPGSAAKTAGTGACPANQVEIADTPNGPTCAPSGGSGTVSSGSQCNIASYPGTGVIVGPSTISCDASQFAGATADVKINAAVNALPATGGTVDAAGLKGTQTIAATLVLGSATKPVALKLPVDAYWECAITNGSPCVEVFPFGKLFSDGGLANGGRIVLISSSNVSEMLRCAAPGSTSICTGALIDGVGFTGNSGATVGHALIDTRGMFDFAMDHVGTQSCPAGAPALWIHQGDSTVGSADGNFYADNFSCSNTGTIPVRITYDNATASSGVARFHFFGGDWGAPGTGNPTMLVDGSPGSDVIRGVDLHGVYSENNSSDTTTSPYQFNSVEQVTVDTLNVGCLNSSFTGSLITISEATAGYTQGVKINNLTGAGCGSSSTGVNNTVTGSPNYGTWGAYNVEGLTAVDEFDYASGTVAYSSTNGPFTVTGAAVSSTVPISATVLKASGLGSSTNPLCTTTGGQITNSGCSGGGGSAVITAAYAGNVSTLYSGETTAASPTGSSNLIALYPMTVAAGGIFSHVLFWVGTPDGTNNSDIGIYGPISASACIAGDTCPLVAHIGAAKYASGAAGAIASLSGAPVTLASGAYYAATTSAAQTLTLGVVGYEAAGLIPFSTALGTASTSTSGALPASITMQTTGQSQTEYIPYIEFYP